MGGYVGIEENNISLPDVGNVEVKVLKEDGRSPLTLVAKAISSKRLSKFGISPVILVRDKPLRRGWIYYRVDEVHERILWHIRKDSPYLSRGLAGFASDAQLEEWSARQIFEKVQRISLTFYRLRSSKNQTEILPTRSFLIDLPLPRIVEFLKSGKVYYEQRASIKKRKGRLFVRNHGSAWRLRRRFVEDLLSEAEPVASRQTSLNRRDPRPV